jgi:hypothetical protein
MRYLILFLIILFPAASSLSQWFDQESINSTVLLEKWQDTSFVPYGTGFAIYNYTSGQAIIATCEHLLRRSEIYITVNADSMLLAYAKKNHLDTIVINKLKWVIDKQKLRAKVLLQTKPRPTYLTRTDYDAGIFLIDLPSKTILDSGDTLRLSKLQAIPRSQIRMRKDVGLGDEIYFVGFPFEIGTGTKLEPLIRSGSVAWLSDSSEEFLIDAFSFGGNSGSPIFSKVILGRKPGEMGWDSPSLIGMIVGHIGDSIEGLLTQPDPKVPAVNRESREIQNYGLARATWIDAIANLIEQADKLVISE